QGRGPAHHLELVHRRRPSASVCRAGRDRQRPQRRRLSPMVARRGDAAGHLRRAGALHARGGARPAARRAWPHRRGRVSLFGLSRDAEISASPQPRLAPSSRKKRIKKRRFTIAVLVIFVTNVMQPKLANKAERIAEAVDPTKTAELEPAPEPSRP